MRREFGSARQLLDLSSLVSSSRAFAALVLCGLVLFVAGCHASNAQVPDPAAEGEAREEGIAVRVAAVRVDSIASLYSTSATLRAEPQATVIARTRGVVRRLLVEEGDHVGSGQPLAELENDEQQIAADRARTTAETARRENERLRGLLEQGLVSEDEYEKSKRDADDARHALALAELELSRTIIRSPFAGRILERYLDVGATVADGTPVYDVAATEPLYADVKIPERHVIGLAVGQQVLLRSDATGDEATARIDRIAPKVDTSTGTVEVIVAVSGLAQLRPGAFVEVDIVTDTHDQALVVPRSALVAEGRRWHLFRLAEDTVSVEQVEVRLGFENKDVVEIAEVLSEDATLEPGTPVVVAGAPALSDGAAVNVVETADSAGDDQQTMPRV